MSNNASPAIIQMVKAIQSGAFALPEKKIDPAKKRRTTKSGNQSRERVYAAIRQLGGSATSYQIAQVIRPITGQLVGYITAHVIRMCADKELVRVRDVKSETKGPGMVGVYEIARQEPENA